MVGPDEALVILDPADDGGAAQAVRTHARVTQSISPRVLVVSTAGADLERIRMHPGVSRVVAGAAPGEIPGLDEQEALFVAAWASRQGGKTARGGDGVAWDAPGFLPPDPPR
jgi:hypothetical protein